MSPDTLEEVIKQIRDWGFTDSRGGESYIRRAPTGAAAPLNLGDLIGKHLLVHPTLALKVSQHFKALNEEVHVLEGMHSPTAALGVASSFSSGAASNSTFKLQGFLQR